MHFYKSKTISDLTNQSKYKTQSGLLYVLFVPILLYSLQYMYNITEKSNPVTDIIKSASTQSLLESMYPNSSLGSISVSS